MSAAKRRTTTRCSSPRNKCSRIGEECLIDCPHVESAIFGLDDHAHELVVHCVLKEEPTIAVVAGTDKLLASIRAWK